MHLARRRELHKTAHNVAEGERRRACNAAQLVQQLENKRDGRLVEQLGTIGDQLQRLEQRKGGLGVKRGQRRGGADGLKEREARSGRVAALGELTNGDAHNAKDDGGVLKLDGVLKIIRDNVCRIGRGAVHGDIDAIAR